MGGEPITVVCLAGGDWRSGPLLLARTRAQRHRGLRPCPGAAGMLLPVRSVLGLGMAVPLLVASLDAAGIVRRVGALRPGGAFTDGGASWIAEMPVAREPPRPGLRLRVVPILAGCPGR